MDADVPDNLFTPPNTLAQARQASARAAGAWRHRILERLSAHPSTIWELAEHFGVSDNRISGRISDLAKDLYIETTGEERINPATNCRAVVYRIIRQQAAGSGQERSPVEQLLDDTYPLTIRIDGDLYDRQPLLSAESFGGVPYARRADTGGLRQVIRVALSECPDCGKSLALDAATDVKKFRCLGCASVWRARTITEPGSSPRLALVKETM